MRVLLVCLVACAAPQRIAEPPSYAPIRLEPPPPRADLYASCLAESVASHRYHRVADEDSALLVFVCNGAPAAAFFDGLAEHSARVQSEFTRDGVTYRATNRVQKDLFGVDYCSKTECSITLNAGEFLR